MTTNDHVPKGVAAAVIQDRGLNQRKLELPITLDLGLGLSLRKEMKMVNNKLHYIIVSVQYFYSGDDDERSCTKRSGCSSDTRSRTKSKKTRASHNSRSRPRSEPASRPKTEKTKKTKKKGR